MSLSWKRQLFPPQYGVERWVLEKEPSGPVHVPGAAVAIPARPPRIELCTIKVLPVAFAKVQVFFWVDLTSTTNLHPDHGPFQSLELAKHDAWEHFAALGTEAALLAAGRKTPSFQQSNWQPTDWDAPEDDGT